MNNGLLEGEGCLRLAEILAPRGPLPVSRSSFYSKVRAGVYPQPIKLGPRTTAYLKLDIRALIERGV